MRFRVTGNGMVGIDPGFRHLLTLSTGENIPHPRELRADRTAPGASTTGTAERDLAARLQERLANQRKDRNHALSRRLVAVYQTIVWSKDGHRAIAKTFGKSVASAGHAQLRGLLAYKCTASGRRFLEVPSRFSTKTCSACGSLSGPTGYAGLQVRQWTCADCGSAHDRDVNAAMKHAPCRGRNEPTNAAARRFPESPAFRAWGGSILLRTRNFLRSTAAVGDGEETLT